MIRLDANGISYIAGQQEIDLDRPVLIFIHGASYSGLLWQAQVQGIAKYANTIAIDLPGHGQSKGTAMDKIEDYAHSIIEFTNHISADQIILCGLSMGGAIVQQLLLDYGTHFKGGILAGTGAKLRVAPEIFEAIESNYPLYVEMIKKIGFSDKTDLDRVLSVVEEVTKCSPEVAKKDFSACNRFDVMARLHDIAGPVLVVTAEHDALTPSNYGDYLEKNIKTSFRAHIKNAGHHVPAECPDAFNKAVINFLDNIFK